MIWPFKKREPALPFAEFVKTLDPAPCGEQEKHYEWKLNGAPCPLCLAIKQHKRKDAELDLLADKIVARLRQTPADAKATETRLRPTWQEAESVRDLPSVDEAVRAFLEDQTGDNSTGMVLAILRAYGVRVPAEGQPE